MSAPPTLASLLDRKFTSGPPLTEDELMRVLDVIEADRRAIRATLPRLRVVGADERPKRLRWSEPLGKWA